MKTKALLLAALVSAAAVSAHAGVRFGLSLGIPTPVVVVSAPVVVAPAPVIVAPAPVVAAAPPACPGVDYVWTAGYWSFQGPARVWVPGAWCYRPGRVDYGRDHGVRYYPGRGYDHDRDGHRR